RFVIGFEQRLLGGSPERGTLRLLALAGFFLGRCTLLQNALHHPRATGRQFRVEAISTPGLRVLAMLSWFDLHAQPGVALTQHSAQPIGHDEQDQNDQHAYQGFQIQAHYLASSLFVLPQHPEKTASMITARPSLQPRPHPPIPAVTRLARAW